MENYNIFFVMGHLLVNSLESSMLASVVLLTLCSTMLEISGGFKRMRPLIKGVFGCQAESYIWVIMANWNRYGISLGVSVVLFGSIYGYSIFEIMKVLMMPVFVLLLTAVVICRLWEIIQRKRKGPAPVKISAAEWKVYIKDALPVLILVGFVVYYLWKWNWGSIFLEFSCYCALYSVIMAACYLAGKLKTYWLVLELLLKRIAAAGIIWGINAAYVGCANQFHLSDQAAQTLFDLMDPFSLAMGLFLLCVIAVLASAVFGMVPVMIVYSLPMTAAAMVIGAGENAALISGIICIWLGNMIFVYRKNRRAGTA